MRKREAVLPRLFIGSSLKNISLAFAIQKNLDEDAEVEVWKQGVFKLNKTSIENLVDSLDEFHCAVFVFAPDDVVLLRNKKQQTIRDNVVFELGLFMGKLGRERVFVVAPKGSNLRIPTDLAGVTLGRFVPNRKNQQAALGPFCDDVRAEIRKLRRRIRKTPQSSPRESRRQKVDLPTFDAVANFSIDRNPNGQWSYGYSRSIGGAFALHTEKVADTLGGKADTWRSPAVDPHMNVTRNKTGATVPGDPRTYDVPPDFLLMHPGEGGVFDIVRWTCLQRGRYEIQGSFRGLDHNTAVADTDVHVFLNSRTELFTNSPVLRGAGTEAPFEFNDLPLKESDTVDFIVGVGPSKFHGSDSTGLRAKISKLRG